LRSAHGLFVGEQDMNMTHHRLKLPHCVIVKSPGLLPMLYKVSELAEDLHVPDRTLRDWLEMGAPYIKDGSKHIWINGREFADWVAGHRKPKRERRLTDTQAYCFRCNEVVEMVGPEILPLKGKLVNVRGRCPKCGCVINRGNRIPDVTTRSNIQESKGSSNDPTGQLPQGQGPSSLSARSAPGPDGNGTELLDVSAPSVTLVG